MRFEWSLFGHRNPETRIQPSDNTGSNPALSARNIHLINKSRHNAVCLWRFLWQIVASL
jgi:hypothetical protein